MTWDEARRDVRQKVEDAAREAGVPVDSTDPEDRQYYRNFGYGYMEAWLTEMIVDSSKA